MHTFEELTDDGLTRLLAAYDEGLASHERGEINYPCGSSARTVKRWRAQVAAEILKRRAKEAAA